VIQRGNSQVSKTRTLNNHFQFGEKPLIVLHTSPQPPKEPGLRIFPSRDIKRLRRSGIPRKVQHNIPEPSSAKSENADIVEDPEPSSEQSDIVEVISSRRIYLSSIVEDTSSLLNAIKAASSSQNCPSSTIEDSIEASAKSG
jgi:hypothetical protein